MEIYAEISKKMQQQLDYGNYTLHLPPNIQYVRKRGSKSLYIECEDNEEIIDMIEEQLYDNGIPFQRNQ